MPCSEVHRDSLVANAYRLSGWGVSFYPQLIAPFASRSHDLQWLFMLPCGWWQLPC